MIAAPTAADERPASGRANGARVAELAIFLVSLIPLLVTPVVPTFDFYNHVGRYFVLSHLSALPYLGQSYVAAWKILPNLGLDVIAMPIFATLPPLIAAKAIVLLIFVAQYGGVLVLNRTVNGPELARAIARAAARAIWPPRCSPRSCSTATS